MTINTKISIGGYIFISPTVKSFKNAILHIRLKDVSYADVKSVMIEETIISDVVHVSNHDSSLITSTKQNYTPIPFEIRVNSSLIDQKNFYAVRAWCDIDSSNYLFSDQSYRVLTHGYGNEVNIFLE